MSAHLQRRPTLFGNVTWQRKLDELIAQDKLNRDRVATLKAEHQGLIDGYLDFARGPLL
jgi:hypothetical protein